LAQAQRIRTLSASTLFEHGAAKGQFGIDPKGVTSPSTDRDFMVQSTGRDMTRFSAFTYDSNYLYFYVERNASSANDIDVWSYLDADSNGLVGSFVSGDIVVHADWQANGNVVLDLWAYQAQDGNGDPLVDESGFADGHDMPGSVSFLENLEVVTGGSADGLSMEVRIAWTQINVSPGKSLQVHIATSDGTNLPSQLDDNMGGADGGVLHIPATPAVPALGGWAVPLFALALVTSGLASGRMWLLRRKS
jgi:hypothetical protein